MDRAELARRVAVALKRPEMPVRRFLDVMFSDAVEECKAGRKAVWPNFGTFAPKSRQPRIYRTPMARKRADRPGETADKFRQVSLSAWSIGFAAAKRLRYAITGAYYLQAPQHEYEWAGTKVIKRLAARAETSSVEAAEMFVAIRKEMMLELMRGLPVYLDGLGTLFQKKRAQRFYSVKDGKGGRKLVRAPARTLVAFRVYPGAVSVGEGT